MQFDFVETGADFNWDFSTLQPITQTVDTFVKVTETPPVYWLFFLTSANMASPLGSSPIEQIPLTDAFNFYNNTSGSFADVGYAATVFGIPLPFKFDNADIIYRFPMDYGNVDSSESGFEFAIPDLAYLKVERKRVNTVDGWGNLTTPFGSFEVLRIKSEVIEYDSIYIDSLNIGIPVNLEYTEYKWLADGQKIPVLIATENIIGTVAEYRDSIRDLTVDMHESFGVDNLDMTIYPNPVSKVLHVRYFSAGNHIVEINIFGLNGRNFMSRKLSDIQRGEQVISFDLSNYLFVPGRYLLQINTETIHKTFGFIYLP